MNNAKDGNSEAADVCIVSLKEVRVVSILYLNQMADDEQTLTEYLRETYPEWAEIFEMGSEPEGQLDLFED